MPSSKPIRTQRFWQSVSDDQLANTELTTDHPDTLDGIVHAMPSGEEEPYVEFAYDLRGSEHNRIRCLQCGQPHLAGFVMRQGEARFLIGHICGKKVYGENFNGYAADYSAAVNRQDALRRIRDLQVPLSELIAWLTSVETTSCFERFARVQRQFRDHMPIISDNLARLAHLALHEKGLKLPAKLFEPTTNPSADYARALADFNLLHVKLAGDPERAVADLVRLKPLTDSSLVKFERVLNELDTLIDLFQPAALAFLAEEATAADNPRKRLYIAGPGLLAITVKNLKGKEITLKLPPKYAVPSRAPIEKLRAALRMA